MNIPFFRYPEVFDPIKESLLDTTRDIIERGAYILQTDLSDFEKTLAEYTGAKYAVGVANATDGLQIGFMAGGLQSGDEVIFCTHTMVATAASIYFAGGVPVPIEAGLDHLMDPNFIESAITKKTKAICPTQLNGRTSDMERIGKLARKHNLDIYEDAAQALGSKWKGQFSGTFGVASCISFYPAKILGCLGDGGAVLTNDETVYNKIMLLRDHGRSHDGDVALWGFNSRLDNIQAAYLSQQFKTFQKVVDRRRQIAARYEANLSSIEELVLPPGPDSDADHFDVFQNYEIEAQRRDELRLHLGSKGIGTIIQWGGKAVHQFRKLGFTQSLPFSENLFKRLMMLPMNMTLSDEEVDYVCDTVKSFYM